MRNKILRLDDSADVGLFATRVASVLSALRLNNVPDMPKEQNLNMEINATYLYYSVVKNLKRKVATKYELNLYKRLASDFPDEAVYPKGDPKQKEEFTSDDLKAYDAVYVYIANEQGKKCHISEDGDLIIEGQLDKTKPNEILPDIDESGEELKSIDDEYYVE